jgi:hypothetical protein
VHASALSTAASRSALEILIASYVPKAFAVVVCFPCDRCFDFVSKSTVRGLVKRVIGARAYEPRRTRTRTNQVPRRKRRHLYIRSVKQQATLIESCPRSSSLAASLQNCSGITVLHMTLFGMTRTRTNRVPCRK